MRGDGDAWRRSRTTRHEEIRGRADDVHAEVAPERFGRLEPPLLPAQEGELDGAPE
jgi:hypothetical protein